MLTDKPFVITDNLANTEIEFISDTIPQSFVDTWYELTTESHFWIQWRFQTFLKQISQAGISLENKYKVLDLGGGTGVLRRQIESNTKWIVDIADVDMNALKQVKPGRGRILYYDIFDRNNEFLESYDIIILYDVLEHISDTRSFLDTLLNHLSKGGLLLINVPALQSLFSQFDKLVGHVRRYNKSTLSNEFSNFEVKILSLSYWGLTLVPTLAARKLLLRILSNRSSAKNISLGYKSPNMVVDILFRSLMIFETSMLGIPPIGSSLSAVIQKK